ncbi:OmcA/MtrC family decaheme c-type cytochrome [Ectothiorhodospiraceae bacterium WFHF3C12]|nr:OmcA/MtrC family decaheme c-type cytochrome [Ectothiorhodospiraceae bacterium WFHF3C12]
MGNGGRRTLHWLAAVLLSGILGVGLGGCGGSDGDDGAQGPEGEAGPAGPPGATAPEALSAIITDVTIASEPVVDFTVTDQHGFPFTGLEEGEPRFTIAKLVPGTNGDTDHWQSYVNEVETAGGVGPGTEDTIQADADGGGTLVNHGNGNYTYTFGTDVTNVTSPLAVPYEPSLTHRAGLQVRGSYLGQGLPAVNATYTFQPSTGMTAADGINNRRLVDLQTCNSCHGELALHGGARVDTDLCVTCHNPGTTDANSGNTVDFRVMIHKIHMGENLPSVGAGTPYVIYGFGDNPHDYSDVAFPQDVRNSALDSAQNCTRCHDPADAATPEASNVTMSPSIEACGSCHDDVDFAAGQAGGHPGGAVTDNSECTTCHAPGRIAGSVAESHVVEEQDAADRFAYSITDVTNTGQGATPQVTIQVTDPQNGDTPYDLLNDPEFDSANGARLVVDIAWSTTDYSNDGDDAAAGGGAAPSRPIEINAIDPANTTANGDGTFTVTSTAAIPAGATGSGAAAIEGHPAADVDGDGDFSNAIEAPVTGVVSYFAITDTSPLPRRSVVDVAKCQTCHGENDGLALHGGNRTDNVQLCVMCHNPNNTDLAMRPADPDGTDDEFNDAAADDREERTIDFKYLIHAIHGSEARSEDLVVYGFSNSVHNFAELRFPREVSDCTACHEDGTFELPLTAGVLGTTIDTQATVNTSSPFGTSDFLPSLAVAQDPSDDGNATATAAVCSSCHDTDLAAVHMEQNGAALGVTVPYTLQSAIDAGTPTESCAVCHGPDRIADVRTMHGVGE